MLSVFTSIVWRHDLQYSPDSSVLLTCFELLLDVSKEESYFKLLGKRNQIEKLCLPLSLGVIRLLRIILSVRPCLTICLLTADCSKYCFAGLNDLSWHQDFPGLRKHSRAGHCVHEERLRVPHQVRRRTEHSAREHPESRYAVRLSLNCNHGNLSAINKIAHFLPIRQYRRFFPRAQFVHKICSNSLSEKYLYVGKPRWVKLCSYLIKRFNHSASLASYLLLFLNISFVDQVCEHKI